MDALAACWDDEAKRSTAVVELARHRPACGAFAAFSTDGSLLVVIGADGGARNRDGNGVEVEGAAAARIALLAGNAGPGGKPGIAVGPEGALKVDGR